MTIPISVKPQISELMENAPINVNAIAEKLGLKIYESDELSEGISGVLLKDKEYNTSSGFVILVNKLEPHARQRFTAAHEIGHFVLHKDFIGDRFEENYILRSDKTSNAQETEANKFAADLLMPYGLVNKLIAQGYKTVEQLAEKLNVSKVAISIRLGLPT